MIKRILCPVDFSETSRVSFGYAESLARHFGATLTVQYVLETRNHECLNFTPPDWYDDFERSIYERESKRLSEFVQQVSMKDVQPRQVIQWGLVPDSVLSLADADQMDLIVLGTHGRRGLDRFLLGSVTEQVIQKAHCQVMAINQNQPGREAQASEKGKSEPKRILCCVDFSENSQRTIDYALSLARAYSADLVVMNVLEDIGNPNTILDAVTMNANRLAELIPKEKPPLSLQNIVRIGAPDEQILAFSEEAHCDLVIVGGRGAHAINRTPLGSTVRRIIQFGHRPVLIVHGGHHA